jgi:signal peptidase II
MKCRFFPVAILILIADFAAKWIVRATLQGRSPVEIIPGFLRLSYVNNTGVAFGFFDSSEFAGKPYILAAIAVAAVAVIFLYGARMPFNRTLLQLALSITMGGILGNFADRLVHGYVIDYIEFHIHESFYWPNFNIADSAITIGVTLLLIDALKTPNVDEKGKLPEASGD